MGDNSIFGSLLQGAAAVADSITNAFGTGYNIFNQEYNKKEQTAQKNWAFADSRTANDMVSYFMKHGSLAGYKSSVSSQDYNDVADYFNPFLSLSGLELQQRAQKLSEEQYKYSKYVTENSAQIRMKDYEKAGLSPLLAAGNTASYSPTSFVGGSSAPVGKNRPSYNNLASLQIQSGIANAVGMLRKTDAEIENIKADTDFKNAQTYTEGFKPSVMLTGIAKDKAAINRINYTSDLIKQQVTTEFYKGLLTKNQIEYYSQQIAELEWNINIARRNGTSTHDNTATLLKYVNGIVGSMGIDLNSTVGKFLVGAGVAIGTGVAVRQALKGGSKKGK